MSPEPPESLLYKRAHFSTRLPVACRYTPAHFWLAQEPDGLLRIGFTKFATRMLGEMVDHHFDVAPGASVSAGQIIGWIEGFKALTELFCIADGEFAGVNPALGEDITLISRDPYGEGWLYRVRGTFPEGSLDADGYRELLDAIIDGLWNAQCAAPPQELGHHRFSSANRTGISTRFALGNPPTRGGSKVHARTASNAASSNRGKPLLCLSATRLGCPSAPICTRIKTTPSWPARRAFSG
ncbi:MAG: glycine cleavage system protein H [Verrucomicrobia bacterium]|nr:glycine cleavage system protein H [Verrucomicrobiota bacterium]